MVKDKVMVKDKDKSSVLRSHIQMIKFHDFMLYLYDFML